MEKKTKQRNHMQGRTTPRFGGIASRVELIKLRERVDVLEKKFAMKR